MLSLKKPSVLPHPPPLHLVKDEQLAEYVSVAKTVGFQPGDLLTRRIREFCRESDIPVYGRDEVYRYLDKLTVENKKHWDWYALREKDEPLKRVAGHPAPGGLNGTCGDFMEVHYQRLVPIEHLQNLSRLEKAFPKDGVRFFVSDYQVKDPDPFICAWTSSMSDPIVFGVWDEPGFGL